MAVIVKPLSKNFQVKFKHEDEEIIFTFHQLNYKTKSEITSMVTNVRNGQVTIDATLQVFYNIKYGLKKVEGIVDAEGKPYELQFEDKEKTELTDECVDELLATELSDGIQFTARELTNAVLPSAILHPLTKKPIEGIEVIPAEKTVIKKKS